MKYMVTGGELRGDQGSGGGFNLIACGSMDEAIAWANKLAQCDGDAIEVRPIEGCWWVYHE